MVDWEINNAHKDDEEIAAVPSPSPAYASSSLVQIMEGFQVSDCYCHHLVVVVVVVVIIIKSSKPKFLVGKKDRSIITRGKQSQILDFMVYKE